MGWIEYLINKEKKLAIEISRNIGDLDMDEYDAIEELFYYISETEEIKLDALNYIISKSGYNSYSEIALIYFMNSYGFTERIHENELPDDYEDFWSDLVKRKYPYNSEPNADDGETLIRDIHSKYSNMDQKLRKNLKTIYTLSYIEEGSVDDDEIIEKFKKVDSYFTIKE